MSGEELEMQEQTVQVAEVTQLPFGVGNVGADRHLDGADKEAYVGALGRHQHEAPSNLWLPFDCMDERPTISLADGTTDPEALVRRKAFQLAGGTVLAFTKAGVAANAAFLRDAKSMEEAYQTTYDLLSKLGVPDAAHAGCGASTHMQNSVMKPIGSERLLTAFEGLGAKRDEIAPALDRLAANKQRRVSEGFYDTWTPAWHAQFVTERNPENFSNLQIEEDDVHGHYASGVLLVQGDRYFAKNAFVAETGRMAFALTFDPADRVAHMLGATDEERALISLAIRDDSLNVTNHIVAEGLEVFA